MSKILSDLNELVAERLTGGQPVTGMITDDELDAIAFTQTGGPSGYIVYAMQTGYTKGARRYSVIALSPKEAVEQTIDQQSALGIWDRITFEVFRQGQGIEYRYERGLREVE